jgi:hypothetical protein
VQEELEDQRAVACEIVLEVADVLESMLPDLLRDQTGRQLLAREQGLVHPHDQHLLVI